MSFYAQWQHHPRRIHLLISTFSWRLWGKPKYFHPSKCCTFSLEELQFWSWYPLVPSVSLHSAVCLQSQGIMLILQKAQSWNKASFSDLGLFSELMSRAIREHQGTLLRWFQDGTEFQELWTFLIQSKKIRNTKTWRTSIILPSGNLYLWKAGLFVFSCSISSSSLEGSAAT